jgi:ankyrin repeat protein
MILATAVVVLLGGCNIVDSIYMDKGAVDLDKMFGQDERGYVFRTANLEYVKENVEAEVVGVNDKLFFTGKMKKVSPLFLVQRDPMDLTEALLITEYLLKNGADPDYAFDGMTLLMCQTDESGMASNPVPEYGELYIKYGADVNANFGEGRTPLDNAIFFGSTGYVKLLIDSGAKLSQNTIYIMEECIRKINDDSGSWLYDGDQLYTIPPLVYAAAEKQGVKISESSVYKEMVSGDMESVTNHLSNIDEPDDSLPIMSAVYCDAGVMDALDKKGYNIGINPEAKINTLWLASVTGNMDVVSYLVGKGAKFEYVGHEELFGAQYEYDNPLVACIRNNQYDIAKYLFSKGFNIDERFEGGVDEASNGATGAMLKAAIQSGNKEMISLLEQNGYPFDENAMYGAIMEAMRNSQNATYKNQYEMVEILLGKGANPNYADDRFNSTPELIVNECAAYSTTEMMELLIKHGLTLSAKDIEALSAAVGQHNSEMVEFLLEKGIPPELPSVKADSSYSGSALDEAIGHGYMDEVKTLVEHGIDLSSDSNGYSYVVYAATDSSNITEYLIDNGADVNTLDSRGRTALIDASNQGNAMCVKMLLKKGADKSIKDNDGKTAIDYAKDGKHRDVMKLLEGAR